MKIMVYPVILLLLSCSGLQQKKPESKNFDKMGRLIRVNYYEGKMVRCTENLYYIGKSRKPHKIMYKCRKGKILAPFSEIKYSFINDTVTRKTFFKYTKNTKNIEGHISYTYENDRVKEVRYYTMLKPGNKSFMFALQQFSYSDANLKQRRFIHYQINPDTLKPMQNCQYVINYNDGKIESMKTWILDEKSKKVIEKNNNSIILITKIMKDLDYNYTKESSGDGFNI